MSLNTVKCPYSDCGYVYRIDVEEVVKDGETTAIRGFKLGSRPRPDPEEYIDLVCPHCKREFQWQIKY